MQNNSLENLKNMGRETGNNGMIIEKAGFPVVAVEPVTEEEYRMLWNEIKETKASKFMINEENINSFVRCMAILQDEEVVIEAVDWLKSAEVLVQDILTDRSRYSCGEVQPMYTLAALLYTDDEDYRDVEPLLHKIVARYNNPKEVWPLAVIHKFCGNDMVADELTKLYIDKEFGRNNYRMTIDDKAAAAVIFEIAQQRGYDIDGRIDCISKGTKLSGKYTQEILDKFIKRCELMNNALLPIHNTHIDRRECGKLAVIEIDEKLYLKLSRLPIDELTGYIGKFEITAELKNYKIVSSYFGNVRCYRDILKHGNIDKEFIIRCAANLNDDALDEADRMTYRTLGKYISAEDMKKMFEIEDNTPAHFYNRHALFLMCMEVFAKDDTVKNILKEIGNTHYIANDIELMFDFADYCLEHNIEFTDIIDITNTAVARVAYAHYLYSLNKFDEIFSAEDKELLGIAMLTDTQIQSVLRGENEYSECLTTIVRKIYKKVCGLTQLPALGIKILGSVSNYDNKELIKYILDIKEHQKPFVEVIEPLKSLLGTYTCDLITPPWWEEFCDLVIDDIRPDKLDKVKVALAHMTENPKLIDVGRVRENGTKLMKMLRKAVKDGVAVDKTDWWHMFNLMRGKNDSKLIYKITDSSLTKIGVSLWTSHWTSCMNVLDGDYREGAISLAVDPEVVVIYATDGKSTVTIEGVEHDDMIARALIRPLRDENGDIQGILLDRIYADGERLKWRIKHIVRRECERMGLKVYRNPYYFKEYSPSKVETMFCRVYAYTHNEYPYMDTINDEVKELSETVTLFSGEVYPL